MQKARLRWPDWWRGVVAAQKIAPGEETGVGEVARFTWRSRLPYDLEFEMTLTGKAPDGSARVAITKGRTAQTLTK